MQPVDNGRRRRVTIADDDWRCKPSSWRASLEGIAAAWTATPVSTRIAPRPRHGSRQQGRFILESRCGGTARMQPVVARRQGRGGRLRRPGNETKVPGIQRFRAFQIQRSCHYAYMVKDGEIHAKDRIRNCHENISKETS